MKRIYLTFMALFFTGMAWGVIYYGKDEQGNVTKYEPIMASDIDTRIKYCKDQVNALNTSINSYQERINDWVKQRDAFQVEIDTLTVFQKPIP